MYIKVILYISGPQIFSNEIFYLQETPHHVYLVMEVRMN